MKFYLEKDKNNNVFHTIHVFHTFNVFHTHHVFQNLHILQCHTFSIKDEKIYEIDTGEGFRLCEGGQEKVILEGQED